MPSLKELLLVAPDHQLDASVKPLIEKWDEEPTSIQILQVLDDCAYAALASGFIMSLLESLLKEAIQRENTTYEAVVAKATWRKNDRSHCSHLGYSRVGLDNV